MHRHPHPVLLGSDGRVWDGHHRIVIAIERGEPVLMVETCANATPTQPETGDTDDA